MEGDQLLLLAEAMTLQLEQRLDEVTREITLLEANLTRPTSSSTTPAVRPTPTPRRRQSTGPLPTPRLEPPPRPTPRPRTPPAMRPVSPPPTFNTGPQFISTPSQPLASLPVPCQRTSALGASQMIVAAPSAIQSPMHLVQELKKPSVDIEKFSGDPTRYTQFCRQFNARIVKNSESHDECMSFLLQFTSGEARDVAQGYAHLDSKIGFDAAIKEFQRRYGDPRHVAHSYVRKALEWPVIRADDPLELDRFGIFLRECQYAVQVVNALGVLEYSENLKRLVGKLPVRMHDRWRTLADVVQEKGQVATFSLLVDFVIKEARKMTDPVFGKAAMQPQVAPKPTPDTPRPTPRPRERFRTIMNTGTNRNSGNAQPGTDANQRKCSLCPDQPPHRLGRCKKFLDKTVKDRRQCVRDLKLCFNCMRPSHQVRECQTLARCRENGCGAAHHTLLHENQGDRAVGGSTVANTGRSPNPVGSRSYFQLLPVYVYANGRSLPTVALLDSASQITIIRSSLARELGLKGKARDLTINTVEGSAVRRSRSVSFQLKSQDLAVNSTLYVSEAQSMDLPSFQCATQDFDQSWGHCHNLPLPRHIKPSQVEILIGMDQPEAHIQLEIRRGRENQPIAVRTCLGWTLMGVGACHEDADNACVNNLTVNDATLHQMMERFWSTESFGVSHSFLRPTSSEDKRSEKILKDTISMIDGRYQVGMLWREADSALPNNLPLAQRRYDHLLKRFQKDPEFAELYQGTVNDYVDKGYARKLPPDEAKTTSKRTWYLPHHGVVNPHKPGRVRVVFDAAASFRNASLNGALMTGPDLLNSLLGVLQRFRMYDTALAADVEAMFMRVRVTSDDADSLRFLYKRNLEDEGPPDVYRMESHIFGASCSPACANFALKQTAKDNVAFFSQEAIQAIENDFYMDDFIKSIEGVPPAVLLTQELVELAAKGGFRLHKWVSNAREVLAALNVTETAVQELDFDQADIPSQRTLGMRWNIQEDTFTFSCQPKDTPLTKRGLVSTMCSVFDPCGFISPFIARAKFMVQDLWREHLDWDQPLPDHLHQKWLAWLSELEHLKAVQIPRHHLDFTSQVKHIEIHVFGDASEAGFGAVAYLRYETPKGDIRCSFLASKTRVAPLKVLTIPRLELQGAVLAARLGVMLEAELKVKVVRRIHWSDSEVVLKYLQNDTKRFRPFIANRVAEIVDLTDRDLWRHVPTDQNPADLCTRGLQISSFKEDAGCLWFHGPQFLKLTKDCWPATNLGSTCLDLSDPELRTTVHNLTAATGPSDDNANDDAVDVGQPGPNQIPEVKPPATFNLESILNPGDVSSWSRLVKKSAWIQRAVQNFTSAVSRLGHKAKRDPNLTAEELEAATLFWVRIAQREVFTEELECLQREQPVGQKSRLVNLGPFYDEASRCLRVGGRLRKASIPEDAKFQLILPTRHPVTHLIAKQTHRHLAHCGQEHLVAELRQKYWPVRAREAAKRAIRDCLLCELQKAKPCIPRMADLPAPRLQATAGPFAYCGVDYWGPMMVKERRSTVKRWGCLFTCLSTRALHLELADSLETDDFLLCLRNFIGRRGHPKEMFSDNGTNFKGADAELVRCLQDLNQNKILGSLSPQGITWHFNPPSAPHFGGAWERLVQSVKTALKATMKNTLVSDSVLRTALIEVEGVLNSRPLTHCSPDPDDYTALTPNHFLIGRADNKISPVVCQDKEINSRRRWRQCQVIADRVCRRWKSEYLPKLTQRHRWLTDPVKTVSEGDLVMLMEDNLPRGKWELGRIIALYPGDDGKVRAVDVKTPRNVFRRPVTKICILEENV
ncbi:uncharacterized protein LOC135499453 [Lineus longissimus]|uniref:uncharacterized protein LOC135499453 n=1 Tax=Lineus longissimus TaxID=88925 RepID=UPI00315DB02A